MQDDFPLGRMNDMLHIDNYKSKNEHDEILFKDCMSEKKLQQSLNEELLDIEPKQYEYKPTVIDEKWKCSKMYIFNICKYNKYSENAFISNYHYYPDGGIIDMCYLYLTCTDLNIKLSDVLQDSCIEFRIGGSVIITVNMMINLFFAKILKKEIVEEDNIIIIPIVIISMCGNIFNMNCLQWHDAEIKISMVNTNAITVNKLVVTMRKEKIDKKDVFKPHQNIITQLQSKICGYGTLLTFNHIINYLIFDVLLGRDVYRRTDVLSTCVIDNDEPYDEVDKVVLIFNDDKKIEFEMEDIVKFDILDRTYYGISLCPELSNEKDMKRFLKGLSTIKKSGINFSVLDTARIFIKQGQAFKIRGVGFNVFRTYDGMGGVAFCA